MSWLSALKAVLISLPEIIRGVKSIAGMFAAWKKASQIAKKEKKIADGKKMKRQLLKPGLSNEKRKKLIKKINRS